MKSLWTTYLQPQSLEDALQLLQEHGSSARILVGGTDVVVELSRGVKPTETIIDISEVSELNGIRVADDTITLGALTTHNDVLALTPDVAASVLPLVKACAEIGAPQLRARGTVAGNLVTASPANDTISALIALDANIHLRSQAGLRSLPIESFVTGFRQTALKPDELIESIEIPRLKSHQHADFRKIGLRRAQAISVVHYAVVLSIENDAIADAQIALGCVAPTVIRASQTEIFLRGKQMDGALADEAARTAAAEIAPIDDIRASAAYRRAVLERALREDLRLLFQRSGFLPDRPVLLEIPSGSPGGTTVNGEAATFVSDGTLLDALRDDLHLTGTKEGCAEGECGACTVWIDGQAVMSCLVPSAQANGHAVTTIEGLAETANSAMHPLQHAFVEHAAVQCGYCIPGMIMAGARLLQERPNPELSDIESGLSGNLCRCTGYTKIIDAVKNA